MYNTPVLIAIDNPEDGMIELTPIGDDMQIPPVPEVQEKLPSEIEYVAGKSLVSFGIMFAGILLLVIILLVIKRKKSINSDDNNKNESVEELKIKNEYVEAEKTAMIEPKKQKSANLSKLSTPNTVQQCIRKFLENTK